MEIKEKILVKAFLLPKDGTVWSCQDRLAIDIMHQRFALADGVSNSYHPEVIAQLLCEKFIDGFINDEELDIRQYLPQIYSEWEENVNQIESRLSGRKLEHAKTKRKHLPSGASTFAGITIDTDNQVISYQIIGDSTLFIINKDGDFKPICSNIVNSSNRNFIQYDNYPSVICADGRNNDDLIIGHEPLEEGYLLLMTDGCAEWFQNAYLKNRHIIEKLWDINDNEEFQSIAEEKRLNGEMDDDLSAIILKVGDSPKLCELVYAFHLPPLATVKGEKFDMMESNNDHVIKSEDSEVFNIITDEVEQQTGLETNEEDNRCDSKNDDDTTQILDCNSKSETCIRGALFIIVINRIVDFIEKKIKRKL